MSPATAQKTKIDLQKIDCIIELCGRNQDATIPILQQIQEELGYVPLEAMEYVTAKTDIKPSELYGVVTFYKQFRMTPVGKYIIKVCHGTACHVKNAERITQTLEEDLNIKDGETTEDGLFTLENVACLGCCSLAPVIMIGDTVYGKLTTSSLRKIIKDYQDGVIS